MSKAIWIISYKYNNIIQRIILELTYEKNNPTPTLRQPDALRVTIHMLLIIQYQAQMIAD